MNTININKKLGNRLLKSRTYTGASNWDELVVSDLFKLSKCSLNKKSNIDSTIIMSMQLYKIPQALFKTLTPYQRYAITKLVSFLFQKNLLDKWLLKKIRIGFRWYYGPADKLSNFTGKEFMYAETRCLRYTETKAEKHLNELMSILFRPKSHLGLGTKRTSFDPEISTAALTKFERIPLYIKHAVFLNYCGCRNYIVHVHPKIFSQQSSEEIATKSSWEQIFRGIGRSGTFGDYEKTLNQNLFILLAELNHLIDQSKKIKKAN